MNYTKEVNVNWHPKTRKLCQVPKEGLEFAFVSKNFHQIHQFVWCKDFLQDAIWGHLNQKKITIFGFCYDPEEMIPLYMNKTRLMVANWKDKEFDSKLLNNCLVFLNAIENQLKMTKTVAFKCKDVPPRYKKSSIFILEGSRRWMKSPPMISLYALLIRAGMNHKEGDDPLTTLKNIANGTTKPYYGGVGFKGANDKLNIESSYAPLKKLLKIGDRRIFHRNIHDNYPTVCAANRLHNNFGFVGFAKGFTKEIFPHWHRLKEMK